MSTKQLADRVDDRPRVRTSPAGATVAAVSGPTPRCCWSHRRIPGRPSVSPATRFWARCPVAGRRLHRLPVALPLPRHRPAVRATHRGHDARNVGARGAGAAVRPAGCRARIGSGARCCRWSGTRCWPTSRSSRMRCRAVPTIQLRSHGGSKVPNRCCGPTSASEGIRPGWSRPIASCTSNINSTTVRCCGVRRPGRYRHQRRRSDRRLQDRSGSWPRLRAAGDLPAALLCTRRVEDDRRLAQGVAVELPRFRGLPAAGRRRRRSAPFRKQGPRTVGLDARRRRHRRLATAAWPGLQVVLVHGPCPAQGGELLPLPPAAEPSAVR